MISKDTWKLCIDLISTGFTEKDAIIGSGISKETFYKRKREDSDFYDSVEKASMAFKLTHLKNVAKAGKESWQASAWLLERKFKREFGRIEFREEITDSLHGKSDEELNEMLAKLEEEENEARSRYSTRKNSDTAGEEEE